MVSKYFRLFVLAAMAIPMFCFSAPLSRAATLKPEEVVAKSLDAIGTAQARAAAKNRVATGTAQFRVLVGGAGEIPGKVTMVSEPRKINFVMKFSDNGYHGEQIITDGDRVSVAFVSAEKRRSAFGDFIFVQDAPIREGLIGGVLSVAWPLLNLEDKKAKLSYEGIKKIDGRDVHDIRYRPKKSTDLEIHLYFDAETFRHVESLYTLSIHPQLTQAPTAGEAPLSPTFGTAGGDTAETAAARQHETRYRIEEKFSDFKTIDGLTLPAQYDLHFTRELQSGDTWLADWKMSFDQISHNVGLDPRNFQVK